MLAPADVNSEPPPTLHVCSRSRGHTSPETLRSLVVEKPPYRGRCLTAKPSGNSRPDLRRHWRGLAISTEMLAFGESWDEPLTATERGTSLSSRSLPQPASRPLLLLRSSRKAWPPPRILTAVPAYCRRRSRGELSAAPRAWRPRWVSNAQKSRRIRYYCSHEESASGQDGRPPTRRAL
jgi:hypothetical protein